jgi:hypothetical protein
MMKYVNEHYLRVAWVLYADIHVAFPAYPICHLTSLGAGIFFNDVLY